MGMTVPARGPGATPLVVVIEDEPMILAAYELMLESWGYGFVGAESAASALTCLVERRLRPDFIIADYRLTDGHTGTQAIELLRSAFGQSIPGVLVTGETSLDTLRDAASTGFPLLRKPVPSRQLQDAVMRCVGPAG